MQIIASCFPNVLYLVQALGLKMKRPPYGTIIRSTEPKEQNLHIVVEHTTQSPVIAGPDICDGTAVAVVLTLRAAYDLQADPFNTDVGTKSTFSREREKRELAEIGN